MLEETALVIDDIESCKAVVAVEELGWLGVEPGRISGVSWSWSLSSNLNLFSVLEREGR